MHTNIFSAQIYIYIWFTVEVQIVYHLDTPTTLLIKNQKSFCNTKAAKTVLFYVLSSVNTTKPSAKIMKDFIFLYVEFFKILSIT